MYAHARTHTHTHMAASGAQVDQWVSKCSLEAMKLAKGQRGYFSFLLSFFACCIIINLSLSLSKYISVLSDTGPRGSVPTASKDLQEERKYVDDVQVYVEGSKNIFLWTHGIATVPHQQLGIKGQELRRKKSKCRQ